MLRLTARLALNLGQIHIGEPQTRELSDGTMRIAGVPLCKDIAHGPIAREKFASTYRDPGKRREYTQAATCAACIAEQSARRERVAKQSGGPLRVWKAPEVLKAEQFRAARMAAVKADKFRRRNAR